MCQDAAQWYAPAPAAAARSSLFLLRALQVGRNSSCRLMLLTASFVVWLPSVVHSCSWQVCTALCFQLIG